MNGPVERTAPPDFVVSHPLAVALREYRRVIRRSALAVSFVLAAVFLTISLPFALIFPGGIFGPLGVLTVLLDLLLGAAVYFDYLGKVRYVRKALPVLEGPAGQLPLVVPGDPAGPRLLLVLTGKTPSRPRPDRPRSNPPARSHRTRTRRARSRDRRAAPLPRSPG